MINRHLRLIEGDGPEVPPLRLHVTHRSLHTITSEIVEAAQNWTAYMIGANALDTLDSGTEYGRLTLRMTDTVTEYETLMMGAPSIPSTENGPVTLW